jgi:arginyl-tRNA synthetase
MLEVIEKQLKNILKESGIEGEIDFTKPPKSEMGDLAFPCFDLAKQENKKPNEIAEEIKKKLEIGNWKLEILDKVEVFGPYVNFFLNGSELAKLVLEQKDSIVKKQDKVMVEFAHPNTHKAFHIGHLRTLITGESVSRILDYSGHDVVRANFQGDVGMHIAKCLYAILKYDKDGIKNQSKMDINDRVKYLGEMYARGSKDFEESESVRTEVGDINTSIYEQDRLVKDIYKETRKWSLEYFDKIYKRLYTKFDRFYFESEVFERGKNIVLENVDKGIFKASQGAIIFEGSKFDLHDRVFINSKGYPTYEAKDMGLAELQYKEHKPDKIIHVVAKEQTEYFKVVIKAQEEVFPYIKDKQFHLDYGWVTLKSGKMSSRTGQVVLGEWLLEEVKKKISEVMSESELKNKEEVLEKITVAAVKYAMLKIGVRQDMAFDINESVSLTGDSGPYLLYIVARIKSILKKDTRNKIQKISNFQFPISKEEKKLLLQVANFSEVIKSSAEDLDPSKIAKYLFELAQTFNSFYENCPVLKAENDDVRDFRLQLINQVGQVMEKGIYLLGIETVDEM